MVRIEPIAESTFFDAFVFAFDQKRVHHVEDKEAIDAHMWRELRYSARDPALNVCAEAYVFSFRDDDPHK